VELEISYDDGVGLICGPYIYVHIISLFTKIGYGPGKFNNQYNNVCNLFDLAS
jgi:hypothetical protein